MIQFHSKSNLPTPESLIGRIVLRDKNVHWTAVGRPRRVVSHSGSKLTVERLPIGRHSTARDGKDGYSTDISRARDIEGETETWMLSVVQATCDTLSEAIYLLNLSLDGEDEFEAMKTRVTEALVASRGLEIEDPEMQVTPKP